MAVAVVWMWLHLWLCCGCDCAVPVLCLCCTRCWPALRQTTATAAPARPISTTTSARATKYSSTCFTGASTSTACSVRKLRHLFDQFSGISQAFLSYATCAVRHAQFSGHAYRMLIGAYNLMLCPIHVCLHVSRQAADGRVVLQGGAYVDFGAFFGGVLMLAGSKITVAVAAGRDDRRLT